MQLSLLLRLSECVTKLVKADILDEILTPLKLVTALPLSSVGPGIQPFIVLNYSHSQSHCHNGFYRIVTANSITICRAHHSSEEEQQNKYDY